ncbi:MAG TPA: hypothetical protein PKC13_07360 [Blastocatellia bacterium]|nr:hypothetical protein [Blastocatellia bacterium]
MDAENQFVLPDGFTHPRQNFRVHNTKSTITQLAEGKENSTNSKREKC